MKAIGTEVLSQALSDIVNEEIDKVMEPGLTNKQKFQMVSGKAVARFRGEFPNVEVLNINENNGEYSITLCVHDLH